MFQPAETEGKAPHLLSSPNFVEPSYRSEERRVG